MTSRTAPKALEYCQNLVRTSDWEGYVSSLFLPASARHTAWAIRAFNVETASIRDNVRDVMIGRMRVQFWRDLIAKVYEGRPPEHPVALALAQSLEETSLSQSWFRKILAAREEDLLETQYPTLTNLENYAESTQSSLLYLQLESLGIKDLHVDHIASHLGKAKGIVTLLRGTPSHLQYRRLCIPSDIMAKHKLSAETVFRHGPSQSLNDAIFDVATHANDHMITARYHLRELAPGMESKASASPFSALSSKLLSQTSSTPSSSSSSSTSEGAAAAAAACETLPTVEPNPFPPLAIPVLLSASASTDAVLQDLERVQFNVFDSRLHNRNWKSTVMSSMDGDEGMGSLPSPLSPVSASSASSSAVGTSMVGAASKERARTASGGSSHAASNVSPTGNTPDQHRRTQAAATALRRNNSRSSQVSNPRSSVAGQERNLRRSDSFADEHSPPTEWNAPSTPSSSSTVSRSATRKDEAIRRNIELELSRRKASRASSVAATELGSVLYTGSVATSVSPSQPPQPPPSFNTRERERSGGSVVSTRSEGFGPYASTGKRRPSSGGSAVGAQQNYPHSHGHQLQHQHQQGRRGKRGTVAAMHPTPSVALHENAKVMEAAAYMAAKRVDAVLAVDNSGNLSGILTDKDLAYRVVAEGLDPRTAPILSVMTHNPVSVITTGSAADALNRMVAGHFRHLPVIDEDDDPHGDGSGGGVVAVLDITKCLYDALEKLEKAYETSRRLFEVSSGMEPTGGGSPATGQQQQGGGGGGEAVTRYAELLRTRLSGPHLGTLLSSQSGTPPVVGMGDTVLEAARRMKAGKETAALVFDSDMASGEEGYGTLAGIFTSKDLVLRVLAAGLDPATTLVHRVMTPHPDCVTPETPVLDALRKMHAGRYLHLPVVNAAGVVEGLVDVLKLTYTTLTQLSTIQTDTDEGPLWNKFWETTMAATTDYSGSELDSEVSESHHHRRSSRNSRRAPPYTSSTTGSNYVAQLPPRPLSPSHSLGSAELLDDNTVFPDDSASRIQGGGNSPPPQNLYNPALQHHHHQQQMHSHTGSHISMGQGQDSHMGSPMSSGTVNTNSNPTMFTYKLKDLDTGKIHRFTASCLSLNALTQTLIAKLGPQHRRVQEYNASFGSASYTSAMSSSTISSVTPSMSASGAIALHLTSSPSAPGSLPHPPTAQAQHPMGISYIDDEGDPVHLETDFDLTEAVNMARAAGCGRLLLSLDAQRASNTEAFGRAVNGMPGYVFGAAGGSSVVSAGTTATEEGVRGMGGGGALGPNVVGSGNSSVYGGGHHGANGSVLGVVSGSVGGGGKEGGENGKKKKRGDDLEGMVGPVLMASGVALVCAFLLGRAFR
ncbi:hypothetical protein HDV05_006035 [Chytridiales sp. JEL 0842]|nr:hypothetical protein HDV05_006035 [Chytridiales sp. JEL 0842]